MTDATAEFFDALVERGHEPLLEKATGTARFDLKDGKKTDRWLGVRRQAPVAGRQLPQAFSHLTLIRAATAISAAEAAAPRH